MDWDALSRLHEKGFIEDPVNKNKSVALTSSGLVEAKRIAKALFGKGASSRKPSYRTSVRYGGMPVEASSAAGVSGILCRTFGGQYFFRVYGPKETFVDYELRHDDLQVTIAPDELASFYRIGEDGILDHSPEVLGLKSDNEP